MTLRVISSNANCMPAGILSSFTTGNTVARAEKLCELLLGEDPDILVLQELYHNEARDAFYRKLTRAQYTILHGPDGSGQAVALHRGIELSGVATLSFNAYHVYGTGPLESSIPKGVIYLQVSHLDVAYNIYALHLQSEICCVGWDCVGFVLGQRNGSEALQSLRWDQAATIRRKQVMALKQWIANSGLSTDNALFIGDFNICYGTPEYTELKTILRAEPIIDREFTTIGASNNRSHHPILWKIGCAIWGGGQLDHALMTAGTGSARGSSPAFKVIDVNSLSDHEAILVVIPE